MAPRRFLPVVTEGCDRRAALQTLAIGALGLFGCRISLEHEADPEASPDAAPPLTDGAPADAPDLGFENCGDSICLDLAHEKNTPLRTVNGFRIITVLPKKYIVVRITETEVATLSAICTHAGCSVKYGLGSQLVCPCHGSKFRLDGSVVTGPAQTPLAVYETTFDQATQIVTINV